MLTAYANKCFRLVCITLHFSPHPSNHVLNRHRLLGIDTMRSMNPCFKIAQLLVCLASIGCQSVPAPDVTVLTAPPKSLAAVHEPVAVWTRSFSAPRKMVVHFMRIDLTSPEIEPFVLLSPDSDGPDGPAEGELLYPQELMKDKDIVCLVNANAFAEIPSIPNPPWKRGWYHHRAVGIEGLTVADGILRSHDKRERMPLWFDSQKHPHLGHPAPDADVRQAVADWFSPLVIDGKVVVAKQNNDKLDAEDRKCAGIGADLHPRTMAGFDDTGRWLLLVVVDGRQRGYSIGITLSEAAKLMKEIGCTQAINLDGGGSSILLFRQPDAALKIVNRPSGGHSRPVPVMFGVRRPPRNECPPKPACGRTGACPFR